MEGSEEVATDLANFIAENTILGNQSEMAENARLLRESGYSDDEILKTISGDFVKQLAESFVGGAASGGLMGAGYSFAGDNSYRANEKAGEIIQNNNRVDDLRDLT